MRFADVVATSTQPALGAIRLAWWREALKGSIPMPPPPEPRLQAVATELLPRGVSGRTPALEDGWATLLDEEPDIERVASTRSKAVSNRCKVALRSDDRRLEPAARLYAVGQAGTKGPDRRRVSNGGDAA